MLRLLVYFRAFSAGKHKTTTSTLSASGSHANGVRIENAHASPITDRDYCTTPGTKLHTPYFGHALFPGYGGILSY